MANEFNWRELPLHARPDSGVLEDSGLRKFLLIHQTAVDKASTANMAELEQLEELFGCLSKLSAFLAQVARATTIAEELSLIPKGAAPTLHPTLQSDVDNGTFYPGMSVTYDQEDIISIFESIIFQAGATMDRLACFIGKHCSEPSCNMLSHMYRTLRKAQESDIRAEYLFRAYSQVRPGFEDLLVGKEVNGRFNRSCLRHDLIHNMSVREHKILPFHVVWKNDELVFRFDYEFEYQSSTGPLQIAVLHTIRELTESISYLTLYASSVFLSRTQHGSIIGHSLAREWDFGKVIGKPAWENPTLCMSEFITAEREDSITIGRVQKRWPNTILKQFHLDKEQLSLAFQKLS